MNILGNWTWALFFILPSLFLGPAWSQETLDVAPGHSHICRLSGKEKVSCWGINDDFRSEHFTAPTDLGAAIEIKSGRAFACAVLKDRSLRCWGSNSDGQIEVPANLGPVQTAALGSNHVCALLMNGKAQCWGSNTAGQNNVPSGLSRIITLTAGYKTTCAIDEDSRSICWGAHALPLEFSKIKKFTKPSISFACAILMDNSVNCWHTDFGANYEINKWGPVKDLAVGPYHICVLTKANEVHCLNHESGINLETPLLEIQDQIKDIQSLSTSIGSDFACGLKSNGRYVCWGPQLLRVPKNLGPAHSLTGTGGNYCALDSLNMPHCWGYGEHAQASRPVLSISDGFPSCFVTPERYHICKYHGSDLEPVLNSAVGIGTRCLITILGRIVCIGDEDFGFNFTSPLDKGPYINSIIGDKSVCGLTQAGKLDCYLGRDFPIPLDLAPVKSIKSDLNSAACALQLDGKLRCFGQGGILPEPSDLPTIINYSLYGGQACAVTVDQDLRCWPYRLDSLALTVPPLQEKVLEVATSGFSGCATVAKDRLVTCWSYLMHESMD